MEAQGPLAPGFLPSSLRKYAQASPMNEGSGGVLVTTSVPVQRNASPRTAPKGPQGDDAERGPKWSARPG